MNSITIKSKNDFDKITPNITELFFGEKFNDSIDNLPNYIKKIKFDIDSHYNKSFDFLPEDLEELILPIYKNHTITELRNLPKNLKVLQLGDLFNQELTENILPHNLTHLTFGYDFNQKITENVLPKGLTHLAFGWKFNQKITENVLPSSLTHLTFGNHFNQEIKENEKEEIQGISSIRVLPLSLQELKISKIYPHKLNLPLHIKVIKN